VGAAFKRGLGIELGLGFARCGGKWRNFGEMFMAHDWKTRGGKVDSIASADHDNHNRL
jgi:hypothetical protein